MRTLLPLIFCGLTGLCQSLATAQQDSSPARLEALKVSIVIPDFVVLSNPKDPPHPKRLVNQISNAHFHVVIENISDQPVVLLSENSPFSLEITEMDGTVLKLRELPQYHSRQGLAYRLAPGELLVREVYYATQEQVLAATHSGKPDQSLYPEFPFILHKDKTVTLRAVFEEASNDAAKAHYWTGRVVSAPCVAVLTYP